MGVIQKILTVNHVHLGKGSTDMTVEQLVTGALEEAFIDMVGETRPRGYKTFVHAQLS